MRKIIKECNYQCSHHSSCHQEVKEIANKAFIRPVMEYANPVWDPNRKILQDDFEKSAESAIRLYMYLLIMTLQLEALLAFLTVKMGIY